jgi:hypothetical protein
MSLYREKHITHVIYKLKISYKRHTIHIICKSYSHKSKQHNKEEPDTKIKTLNKFPLHNTSPPFYMNGQRDSQWNTFSPNKQLI